MKKNPNIEETRLRILIQCLPEEALDEVTKVFEVMAKKKKEARDFLEGEIITTVEHLIDPDRDLEEQLGEIEEWEYGKRLRKLRKKKAGNKNG